MKPIIRAVAKLGILFSLCLSLLITLGFGQSQVPPPTLEEALRRLPVCLRVLHVGAHPDDENNSLLVYLSRGLFARTAYLSATRGDGGQNIIGNELGEALGVLRTEELLAAQRVEAVDQYFTRAYDFGFTRRADETLSKWGHDEILADFVRVIRRFRPDIIISRFSGTPNDGHGQHQAAGILAKEAFRAAGDPNQFPEQLAQGLYPWQAKRLYLNRGRFGENREGVSIDLGVKAPWLGKSYSDLGIEALSFHKSQFMLRGSRQGSFVTSLQLIDAAPKQSAHLDERDLTEGIDASLMRIAEFVSAPETAGHLISELSLVDADFKAAIAGFHPNNAHEVIAPLRSARRRLFALYEHAGGATRALDAAARDHLLFALKEKLSDVDAALTLALGLSAQAKTASSTVTPGDAVAVHVTFKNSSDLALTASDVTLEAPQGSNIELGSSDRLKSVEQGAGSNGAASDKLRSVVETGECNCDPKGPPQPGSDRLKSVLPPNSDGQKSVIPGAQSVVIPPGRVSELDFLVRIPDETPPTEPYWLRLPRNGDRFNVEPPTLIGLPELPAPLRMRARIKLSEAPGDEFELVREVATVAPAGETDKLLESVRIVPKVVVAVSPEFAIVSPMGSNQIKRLKVEVASQTSALLDRVARLDLPSGWSSEPRQVPFVLRSRGQRATFDFSVRPPPTIDTGRYSIRALAKAGPETFSRSMTVIRYPHVKTNYLYRPAETAVGVFDARVAPGSKVGYVTGHGDLMPPAVRALGIEVEELNSSMLAEGNLNQFDCIVIGSRAYEGRQDLVAHNDRVLEYVRNGGTLIVEYQVTSFNDKGFPPFALRIANDERVTDENAPIRILDPGHPLFRFPNQITDNDLAGWVQERGLYFAGTWDEKAFKPLLESHDAGEKERYGGMLIADYGKGHYIYSAYAWFRQLPAGVPGAYRIFANLVSFARHSQGK